jgi:P-type Cu+ transporter
MPTATDELTAPGQRVDLAITGMTCAACAARIEKKLNRLDGVTATVNYATEKAAVTVTDGRHSAQELIDVVESIGYGASLPAPVSAAAGVGGHAVGGTSGEEAAPDPVMTALRHRLVTSLILGVPVLALSMVPALQFRNWQWLSFALAAPVATWAAWPFHRTAWKNLGFGEATMDTLISVGVAAAFGWSTYALFFTAAGDNDMTMPMSIIPTRGEGHHLYLEVASATVALILLGRWLELRARRSSTGALRALAALVATDARVIDADGRERVVPAGNLNVGDHFVVRPGERVATDGVVVTGSSALDMSLITGESLPVDVGPGDEVVGATVNTSGRLVVEATRVGEHTALASISRLVEQAQTGKAPVQRLADRVSGVFVPVAIALAVVTLGWWAARTGSFADAMEPAVSVLIIACPCALGLATPTALAAGTGRGAQLGLLIRGPEVLEHVRRIDTVVLDKTGTVTTGEMAVSDVQVAAGSVDETELVRLAAAVELGSEHPIGRAIVRHAEQLAVAVVAATDTRAEAGSFIEGTVDGVRVRVGRPAGGGPERGLVGTVVEVTADSQPLGVIAVSDTVRPDSRAGVAELRRLGLRPVLLTGDNATVAASVAADVGIDATDVIADVRPADKLAVVRRLQDDGRIVAMVGDGVNDAAALTQADLGVAMASGTDVAKEASDLTVMRSNVPAVGDAIRLGRRTLGIIKGNLVWAFGYNVVAIPLAMSWRLSPFVAGAAMACSSVFVVTNSLRLRRFTPQRRAATGA